MRVTAVRVWERDVAALFRFPRVAAPTVLYFMYVFTACGESPGIERAGCQRGCGVAFLSRTRLPELCVLMR